MRRIEWTKQGVTLCGERAGQRFESVARRCLVSVSVGVLAAPASMGIEFSPALAERNAALSGLGMGQVAKVVLTLKRASFPRPFEEGVFTLFFCGEALSASHAGTTSGALGSGQHAARAILRAMSHP